MSHFENNLIRNMINYKGEDYPLFCNNNDILKIFVYSNEMIFSNYNISKRKVDIDDFLLDFIGMWSLKNNQIYLTRIETSDESIYHDGIRFETPVHANWYVGDLYIEIGADRHEWYNKQEEFLFCKINRGCVIERKILLRELKDKPIGFGMFKGLLTKEVLFGEIRQLAQIKYIEELIRHINDVSFRQSVFIPKMNLDNKSSVILNNSRNNNVDFFITKDYVALRSSEYKNVYIIDHRAHELSNILEDILKSNFDEKILFNLSNEKLPISQTSLLFNPNIEYFNWAITNVSDFCLSPLFINRKHKFSKIRTFEITRINNYIFEYTAVIKEFEFEFSDAIKKINNEKFEAKFNLRIAANGEYLEYTYSEEELLDKYGIFINESHIDTIEDSKRLNFSSDKRTSSKYPGTFAQDYEGLDDDFIDYGLDGDPDAYWNID